MILIQFAPLFKKKTAKGVAVILASTLLFSAISGTAQAEVKVTDAQGYATMMKSAANAKNMNQVAELIADDAIISITRNGKFGTMGKKEYLQRLQDNWEHSSKYTYNITIDNVVSMGNKAKADITTVETLIKDGQSIKFVTSSRATLIEGPSNTMLLKSVSQVTIN